MGAVGLAIGSTVFFYWYPGKPKIAVIDIPFTVIDDRSNFFEVGAMLDYVRDDGSINGVVISLNSPGGGAAPSEELFFEMVSLRETWRSLDTSAVSRYSADRAFAETLRRQTAVELQDLLARQGIASVG